MLRRVGRQGERKLLLLVLQITVVWWVGIIRAFIWIRHGHSRGVTRVVFAAISRLLLLLSVWISLANIPTSNYCRWVMRDNGRRRRSSHCVASLWRRLCGSIGWCIASLFDWVPAVFGGYRLLLLLLLFQRHDFFPQKRRWYWCRLNALSEIILHSVEVLNPLC